MNTVRIVHPQAGEADVPESAVPAWRSSGWRPVSEVEAEVEVPQEDKPSRARRRSNEEE
jgi:hypothetical protein